MSYLLYNTEGIILDRQDIGEADRMVSVFTKDFGKINVFAKGVRLQKSKLAPSLNLFSCSRLSFVSGKDIWRLTDAEEILTLEKNLSIFGTIVYFLNRMVRGEEKDEKLWNVVKSTFLFLASANDAALSDLKDSFELLTKLRILNCLGYVSLASLEEKKFQPLVENYDYSEEGLQKVKISNVFLDNLIAKGISSSSL